MLICYVSFVLLGTLFQLLDLFLLQGYLAESRLQLDYRFTLLPHIDDFATLADRADATQFNALFVEENAPLFPILVFQLGQVLDHGVDVDALQRLVLLEQALHLSHLLVEHGEELGRFFNFYSLLSKLSFRLI